MNIKKILFSIILILGFNTSSNSQVPSYLPKNGLLSWWPFSGNANDGSGNGCNGIVNEATLTTDRFGNSNMAMDFNGISDYLSIDNALPDAAKFSISVWVLHTKISSPSCILSDADDVPYNDVIFNLSDDGMTNDEFLKWLLESEYDYRRNVSIERLIRSANFRYKAYMEKIDYTIKRNLDRNQLERLASLDFIRDGQNIFITGVAAESMVEGTYADTVTFNIAAN
jgi:hypothetical protein